MCMQGWEKKNTVLDVALAIANAPEKFVTGVEKANTAIYDFFTPDALQRKVIKYNTLLAVKKDDYYLYKRGVVFFLLGRFPEAIQDLENSIKCTKASNFQQHYYLGMIHTRLAHYTDAVQAYTSAISSFCETTEPSKVEKITNSLRQKKRNLSRFNHSVTESFIKKLNINDKANVVEKQKYREQVEDTIDSVFTVKLNKDDILNNRALAYANAGNYLEAIFDLEQIEEESHQFLFNLGFVHYFNNNSTCAQEYIVRAIELAGNSVPSMYSVYLACVLERTNQLDQAETIRKNLLAKHPHMVVRPFHYKFLPDSVMMNVASFLDHKSLLNLGRTCRALQTLTKHHSLWDNIQCTHNQCTFQTKFDKYIEFVLARSETIERVSIPYIMEPVPQIANRKLKSFYTIIFNSNCMSHVLDLLNKNDISQIESFSFDMRSYNDDIALECSRLDESNFTHLRKLDLSGVTIKLEKWEKILFVCGKNLVSCSWKGNNKYIQDLVERMCPQLGFKEKNSMEKVVYTLKSYSK